MGKINTIPNTVNLISDTSFNLYVRTGEYIQVLSSEDWISEGMFLGFEDCDIKDTCYRNVICSKKLIKMDTTTGIEHVCGRVKSLYGKLCIAINKDIIISEQPYTRFSNFLFTTKEAHFFEMTNRRSEVFNKIPSGNKAIFELEIFKDTFKLLVGKVYPSTYTCPNSKCPSRTICYGFIKLVSLEEFPIAIHVCVYDNVNGKVFCNIDQTQVEEILEKDKNSKQFKLLQEMVV